MSFSNGPLQHVTLGMIIWCCEIYLICFQVFLFPFHAGCSSPVTSSSHSLWYVVKSFMNYGECSCLFAALGVQSYFTFMLTCRVHCVSTHALGFACQYGFKIILLIQVVNIQNLNAKGSVGVGHCVVQGEGRDSLYPSLIHINSFFNVI